MATEAKIVVTADTSKATAGLNTLTRQLNVFGKSITGAFSGVSGMLGALGVTLSAGAVGVGMKRLIDQFDQLNDASQQLGLTSEYLSEMGYAAEQSGSSVEELQQGLKFLNKNLVEAQQGNKNLATTFREFGITAIDDTETALAKLADGFAAMPDGAKKTNVALELLGRGGLKLVPLLNQGSAGLERFREEARKLGISISGETIKAADDFNDRLNTIGNAVKGMGQSLTQDALPYLSQLAEGMANAARTGGTLTDIIAALVREVRAIYNKGAGSSKEGILGDLDKEEKKLADLLWQRQQLERQYNDPATPFKSLFKTDRELLGRMLTENATKIMATEEAIGKLNKQLIALNQNQTNAGTSASTMAGGVAGVGTTARNTAAELAALEGTYSKLIRSLQEGQAASAAGPQKALEKTTVLDVNALRDKAKQALEQGDAESAAKSIERAKQINDYLLETGQVTASYYKTQADLLLGLAKAGEKIAGGEQPLVAIGIDQAATDQARAEEAAISQAFWDQNPAYQAVYPVVQQQGITSGNITGQTADGRVIISAKGMAAGGLLRGPGTGTSDSILARVSNKEFIVNARQTARFLPLLDAINRDKVPRFAAGGLVQSSPVAFSINLAGGSYTASASPDVAAALRAELGREVLRRGRR